MLPYTLDAVDEALLRDGGSIPNPSDGSGRLNFWENGERSQDGRATGMLIQLGGCFAVLEDTGTGQELLEDRRLATRLLKGRVIEVPEDNFTLAVLRQDASAEFSLFVMGGVGDAVVRAVRSPVLKRVTGYSVEARVLAWSSNGLSDPDLARLVALALDLRADGASIWSIGSLLSAEVTDLRREVRQSSLRYA